VTSSVFLYAFVGGLLPSFIWLYFVLKEDACHPEPKRILALAFIGGMIAVPLALVAEKISTIHINAPLQILMIWALIEEFLKYGMAAMLILWRGAVDEAPDYVIYMITAALGFAAAENMLFLANPLLAGLVTDTLFTGNIRFLGSTLLHVIASAAIGFALAFSATAKPLGRMAAGALGLILAVALHTAFNALIISSGTSTTLAAFFLVWVGAVVFIAVFEVLKYFRTHHTANTTC
jgi:protease PrsW